MKIKTAADISLETGKKAKKVWARMEFQPLTSKLKALYSITGTIQPLVVGDPSKILF